LCAYATTCADLLDDADIMHGIDVSANMYSTVQHVQYCTTCTLLYIVRYVDVFVRICCRQSEQRRLALLENMVHATVLVSVKTLRRWKLLSMANTHVASAERFSLYCVVRSMI